MGRGTGSGNFCGVTKFRGDVEMIDLILLNVPITLLQPDDSYEPQKVHQKIGLRVIFIEESNSQKYGNDRSFCMG